MSFFLFTLIINDIPKNIMQKPTKNNLFNNNKQIKIEEINENNENLNNFIFNYLYNFFVFL